MADHDDVIVSPSEPLPVPSTVDAPPSDVVTAPPRRRLVPMFVASGAVLVLIMGIGAYVIYRGFLAGGPPPERLMPASVAAFVSVDLELSLSQRVTLAKLAGKTGGAQPSADASADEILSSLLDELDLTGVDVERDLMSWLGLRVGVGVWFHDRDPYVLLAATSKDDEKATAGLGRVKSAASDGDLGFVVRDGQALVAFGSKDGQRVADAAAAEAAATPLESLASFRTATTWLGDDQLAIAWTDNQRLSRGMVESLQLDVGSPTPPVVSGSDQGTWVLGVKATEDGFEARYRSFGAKAPSAAIDDAMARLSRLPADTAVGAVAALPKELTPATGSPISPYSSLFGLLAGGLLFGSSTVVGPAIGPGADPLTPEEQAEVEKLLGKDPEDLTPAEEKRLEELIGFSPNDLPDMPEPRDLTPAEQTELDKLLGKDPEDLTPTERKRLEELIGVGPVGPVPDSDPLGSFEAYAGATFSLALIRSGGSVLLHLVVDATSADAAASIAKVMKGVGDDVAVEVRGDIVTMGSKGYVAGPGRLGDSERFQRVMAGAPARADVAVYADLEAVLTAEERQRIPLRAVGLVQGTEAGDQVGVIRILV